MPIAITLALRTIARRKGRMALIGSLVAFGTFLIVFGSIFASSTGERVTGGHHREIHR